MSVLNSNPFLIASGSPTDPTFPVQRSLRLRSSASAYLSRVNASTATDLTKWTLSFWVKRGTLGVQSVPFGSQNTPGTGASSLYFLFSTSNTFSVFYPNTATTLNATTTAVFRDTSAWYHFVITYDSTQALNLNRIKIFVNGEQQVLAAGAVYPALNATTTWNSNCFHSISKNPVSSTDYFDGYITEINSIDGQALTPSSFGGYNAGTNVWEVRKYTGTYGTNGFYLPFTLDTTSTYAGSFNGTAKYISAPNNAVFAQQSATNWTVEGWVYSNSATLQQLFVYGNSTISTGNDVAFGLAYTPGSTASLFQYNGTTNTFATSTLNVPLGQWCHIAAVNNGGTVTIYINGVACGTCAAVNTNSSGTFTFYVGNYGSSRYINGQVSNFRLVKGTAVYTSNFVPSTTPLTAITNTALLTLQNATIVDNSTNAFTLTNTGSLATIAATPYVANVTSDASGNKNNWIPNNINASVSGVTYDSMLDVPTNTGSNNSNFAVLNPLDFAGETLKGIISEGNLKGFDANSVSYNSALAASIGVNSGKWYCEATSITQYNRFGIAYNLPNANIITSGVAYYGVNGVVYKDNVSQGTFATYTNNDVIGMALDADAKTIAFYKNGTLITTVSYTSTNTVYFCFWFQNNVGSGVYANFGQRPFAQTPPSGFKSLNTYNLPEPTIPRGDKYFKQYLYTGNGGGQQIGEIQKPASLFNLDRSLRFRKSNSAYLSRTQTTTTNSVKCTFSGWVKRGELGTLQVVFGGYTGTDADTQLYFDTTNQLKFTSRITNVNGAAFEWVGESAAVFRDPQLWLHIVVKVDTSVLQATNNAYYTVYVNGIAQTFTTVSGASLVSAATVQNRNTCWNVSGYTGTVARQRTNYFDGYLSDLYFIDGQALDATSFGAYDGNNYWTPIAYTGTYGTNGFHLEFEDYSAASASAIGKDTSGNGNNFTPTGINLTTPEVDNEYWDSYTDVPTLKDVDTCNYCTLDPLQPSSTGLRNGNLTAVWTTANIAYKQRGTYTLNTGKWYFEGNLESFVVGNTGNTNFAIGFITTSGVDTHVSFGWTTTGATMKLGYRYDVAGVVVQNVTYNTVTPVATDIFGIEYDVDNGTANFYKNGTLMGSASGLALGTVNPHIWRTGSSNSATMHVNFGQRAFKYGPSTGYKKINAANVVEVTGDVETPDFVWIKSRSAATGNALFSKVTGEGKYLSSNSTAAEVTDVNSLIQFNKNGFLLGNSAIVNTLSNTYVASAWKAGNTTVTNTDGTITSQVRANQIAGFSEITYTGTGANGTVGHGLGVAPKMIIVKPRTPTSTSDNWEVYHVSTGNGQFLTLNSTAAATTASNRWNNTSPTSTVFSIGTAPSSSADDYVAYCFSEIAGYSKFGSYTGNGSTDGPFVYTGFRPRWVLLKLTSSAGGGWYIYDTSRNTYNVMDLYLRPDAVDAQTTFVTLDALSNGFKIRTTNTQFNGSGSTYIYAAFAENPFKYSLGR